MGVPVLIIGESGTGKSTSLRNLKNAGIINVYGKPLPFKSELKTVTEDSCERVIKIMENAKSDVIVIDDFQGLLVTQFMGRAKETGYAKCTVRGSSYYNTILALQKLLP